MRRVIADLYKIAFKITGSKLVSLLFALTYITALNLLTIYGLVIMTEEWIPELLYAHRLFVFPYFVVTALAMFAFNFWLMLPLHKLSEEVEIKPIIKPIIIYSIVSALLFAYTLLIRNPVV